MERALRGIREALEPREEFAASIMLRDESLGVLASTPGLGPPDLCWLQKSAKGSWSSLSAEPRGYFHFCLGRDVSSSAAIAAYFAELNSLMEPISFMQGLWYSAETKIERGFYCCYDPFARVDVRCELCIPGGVVCGALDANGTVHEVTPEIWRNCQLASFLRYELYDADLTSHANTLRRYDPCPTPGDEKRLLDMVEDMYRAGLLPDAVEVVQQDTGAGCTAEHMDLVLLAVFHHFRRHHRWAAALKFFERLQEAWAPAAVYVAAAQRELDSFEGSFATLSGALERAPSSPALLVALANECMYAGQVEMAAKLARRAIRVRHTLRPAWLLLSRCYARLGLYTLSLITLNVVPPPPAPAPELEMLFCVPPPETTSVTKPAAAHYDPEVSASQQMSNEEVGVDGSRHLLYLPGAVMVNREPLDLGPWADTGPYRVTRAVLAAAYALLQELVAAVGWDSFLDMRSRVFVMHAEAQAHTQQQLQQQGRQGGLGYGKGEGGEDEEEGGDLVLEELAAMGLQDHPQELAAARTANAAVRAGEARAQGLPAELHSQFAAAAAALDPASTSSHGGPGAGAGEAPGAGTGAQGAQTSSGPSVVELSGILGGAPGAGPKVGEAGAASSGPSAIQGSGSLWSVVFGGSNQRDKAQQRPELNAASLQQLHQHSQGPVAEGCEACSALPPQPHAPTSAIMGWAGPHGPAGLGSGLPARPPKRGLARRVLGRLLRRRQVVGRGPYRPSTPSFLEAVHAQGGVRAGGPVAEADYGSSEDEAEMIGEEGYSGEEGSSMEGEEEYPESEEVGGDAGVAVVTGRGRRGRAGLRSFEADREAAIMGTAPEDEEDEEGDEQGGVVAGSGGSSLGPGKRMCVRWLDELIIALWHDLQAYMEWKAQDSELVRTQGNSLAGLVLGLPPANQDPATAPVVPDTAAVQQLPPGDWMRRGLLAERLFHDGEALLAYRCCCRLGGFNLVALTAIMRLAAHVGNAQLALQAACVVLAWHESKHPPQPPAPKQQRTPSLAPPAVPLAVSCCVAHLAAQLGADALSDHVSELDAEAINESMNFEKGKAGSVTPASVSSAQQMMNNLLTATRSPNW